MVDPGEVKCRKPPPPRASIQRFLYVEFGTTFHQIFLLCSSLPWSRQQAYFGFPYMSLNLGIGSNSSPRRTDKEHYWQQYLEKILLAK